VSTVRFKPLLIVLLAAAVIPFFVKLDDASIWDANEAFYVETPREMIESGDWVNPSFNYEPRFNKPVLSYWIVAALYQVFGVSVGVERAAIAAAAMVMLIAVWFIARAASIRPLAPLLATLGLAAGPRFFMFSRRIFVDMAVTAMMTLTLLFFVLAERYPSRRRLFLVLMYVSVGLGVLTKGPVAAVIPFLAFVVYLAVHRELGRLRDMMIPLGTLIALAIAVPWYVALYQQHGWTYISEFFIGENFDRFTGRIGDRTRGPWFYLQVLPSDPLPWSLCLPAVVWAWWADRRRIRLKPDTTPQLKPDTTPQLKPDTTPQLKPDTVHQQERAPLRIRTLLLLWIGIIVVFFSLSQTKQDLYIFPIVAAVAALGGDWVARALAGDVAESWFNATLTVFGIVLIVLGAAVLYLFGGDPLYAVNGAPAAAIVAMAGGVFISIVPWRRRYTSAVCAVLIVLIAFNWILAVRALPDFERYKPVVPLSQIIELRAGPGDVVAHVQVALPSMVYYLRRHIDSLDRETLTQQLRSDRRVFAVMPADRYDAYKAEFGVPTCIIGRHRTSDFRLRAMLERLAPSEVLVITNRCPAT
jgi:4-amino-4-deoxy-L-arabinose transferase-like glycosyltransferase